MTAETSNAAAAAVTQPNGISAADDSPISSQPTAAPSFAPMDALTSMSDSLDSLLTAIFQSTTTSARLDALVATLTASAAQLDDYFSDWVRGVRTDADSVGGNTSQSLRREIAEYESKTASNEALLDTVTASLDDWSEKFTQLELDNHSLKQST